MHVDTITAGALVRKELRNALAYLELIGLAEYREVKGLLDSVFVIKADRKTWGMLIDALHAWRDFS